MKSVRALFWTLLCALAFGAPLHAQEVQVPLDQAGRVERIDARLAERLGILVDEYPGLVEARLFRLADGSHVLEITTRRDGQTVRDRRPLSEAEVAALRARVSERALERAPSIGLNQEGRSVLLAQTTGLGLTYYGLGVPYVLGLDDGTSAAGAYMLTAATSFFLPFALTQNQPVTYGMANLSRYGATRGLAHGVLLFNTLAGEAGEQCRQEFGLGECRNDESHERGQAGTALLASVAEAVGGYVWARNTNMTAGTAATIGNGGDLGLLWGLGTSVLVAGEDIGERTVAGLMLAGSVAGIEGGRRLAARRDYTWGDASLMYGAGVLGTYTGLAAASVTESGEERLYAAAGLAGSAAGVVISDRLLRDKDFTVGQASLVQLGTIAGAASGLGLAFLVGGGDGDPSLYLVTSALGAIGGFAGTYRAVASDAAVQRGERLSGVRVRLSPASLVVRSALRGDPAHRAPVLPLASVEYRFGGGR